MSRGGRKVPFSGKAKKQQLQSKRQSKSSSSNGLNNIQQNIVMKLNQQSIDNNNMETKNRRGDGNRYALTFFKESDEEVIRRKEEGLLPLNPVTDKEMEINSREFFPSEITFPKRPEWDFNMTHAQLNTQEQRYFKDFIDILKASSHWKDISYFELNLETWRQLWRVMEMSDILLHIVDVRYAGAMFPPSLYDYVVKKEKKSMILVLNKIDLVPASVVAAWKEYFTVTYPGLKVIYFTSCPVYNLRDDTTRTTGLLTRRRKGLQRMCAEGASQLLAACREIVQGQVDLSTWEKKIKDEMEMEINDGEKAEVGETVLQNPDTTFYEHKKYKNGVLTIGCVGQPNVGKSSLMNAIMGKKVVSVSRTPGHTKHFQTIFLTPKVRLCDCPGLVFPSKVPRPVQILMGSFPIAQLRDPYTTIRYLAERLDLPNLLKIDHPEEDEIMWSPRNICDGWAKKMGYFTARAGRLDTFRGANCLLRMALDGKICLWLRPPGFTRNKEIVESEEVKYVKWVQAFSRTSAQDDNASEDHVDADVLYESCEEELS